MISEYIRAALKHARCELIQDENLYYGEIDGIQGVWASAKTLEECRETLAEVLDRWLLVRLSRGLAIPPIDGVELRVPRELNAA